VGIRFFNRHQKTTLKTGKTSPLKIRWWIMVIIGHSIGGRLVVVSFTETTEGVVRIISARPATKKEREDYEENCNA
jgi:uncharacterized DUF497 family protein